jgi:nitrite reductase/ring-hydroxylating ferredoxin subunit
MDFRSAVAQLDSLVRTLEREGDERALMLLQLVDAIHRPALERIAAGDLDHPVARALLAMYDLTPVEERVLVEEALDAARASGAQVEFVGVEEGVVRVRTDRADAVEQALREGYETFRELVVEGEPRVVTLPLAAPTYVDVEDVDQGELKLVSAGGSAVLLVGVEGQVYAFRNECAVDGMPLEGARLTGTVIVCPWHNCAYDARSGERVDGEDGGRLRVVPVARRDGGVKVAV